MARHPLAYIVEAADDICYLTADIQDAARIEQIDTNVAIPLLKDICSKDEFRSHENFDNYERDKSIHSDYIAYLRTYAIRRLVRECADVFDRYIENIFNGCKQDNLLNQTDKVKNIKNIREICEEKVYIEPDKLKTEVAGFTAIRKLIDFLGEMIEECRQKGTNDPRIKHIFILLPEEYRKKLTNATEYQACLILSDYISGMTDRYALNLYQRLTGNSSSIDRMM